MFPEDDLFELQRCQSEWELRESPPFSLLTNEQAADLTKEDFKKV